MKSFFGAKHDFKQLSVGYKCAHLPVMILHLRQFHPSDTYQTLWDILG